MPGSSKIHPAPVVDQVPNQLHGCLDGMWQEDPEKLRAYLAGGDCGDAGFCHGLCPPNMQVAPDSDQRFVAEPNRYVLYVSAGCPFAARPWMVSCALGLVDNGVLRVSRVFPGNSEDGWFMVPVSEEEKKVAGGFEGENTHDQDDPVFKENGWTHLRQMYKTSNPNFSGKVSVPVLYDAQRKQIVNNQSFDCAMMIAECLAPPGDKRPVLKPTDLFGEPRSQRRDAIRACSTALHADVNIRPYKVHFAQTQKEYQDHLDAWYAKLRELEAVLDAQPWVLPGEQPTFCDFQLFASLVRWELVYRPFFRMQEWRLEDFPNLFSLVKRVYKIPGVGHCIEAANVSRNYYLSHPLRTRGGLTTPRPPQWLMRALQGDSAFSKQHAGINK